MIISTPLACAVIFAHPQQHEGGPLFLILFYEDILSSYSINIKSASAVMWAILPFISFVPIPAPPLFNHLPLSNSSCQSPPPMTAGSRTKGLGKYNLWASIVQHGTGGCLFGGQISLHNLRGPQMYVQGFCQALSFPILSCCTEIFLRFVLGTAFICAACNIFQYTVI